MSYTEEEGNFINFVHSMTAAAVPEDSVKNKVCACVKNPHYRAPPELPLEIDSEVEARYGRKPAWLICTICGLPPRNTEGFESFKVGKGNMTFWAKPKVIYAKMRDELVDQQKLLLLLDLDSTLIHAVLDRRARHIRDACPKETDIHTVTRDQVPYYIKIR